MKLKTYNHHNSTKLLILLSGLANSFSPKFPIKLIHFPFLLPFFLGEPFHLDQHWYYGQRLDTGTKPWTNPKAVAAFLTIFFTFYCLCFSPYPRYWFPIMAEQKPPRDCDIGKVKPHYTFERIED